MTLLALPHLITLSLALPFLAAATAFLFTREGSDTMVPYTLFALGGASALATGIWSFVAPQTLGALAPLQAFFYAIVGAGVLLASVYAIGYLRFYRDTYALPWLAFAYGAFVVGMELVVLSSYTLTFLISWELMSVAAYFLVVADGTRDSERAGFMYIVMTQLGFAAIATAFLLLSNGQPLLLWNGVAQTAATLSPVTRGFALALFLIGFGSKAGLVPLHQWLPYAHPQAPSHASALLSGVMLNVALFGFITALTLFPEIPLWFAGVVIAVGFLSALTGALHAAVEDDIKALLAWSSIENMGLIFSAVGVALAVMQLPPFPLSAAIMSGVVLFGLLHTINHFLFKTSLFMVAGTIVAKTHTRSLDALGGLAKVWPRFSGIALALVLAAVALPPFGSFFGEWAYLQSLAIGLGAPTPIALAAVALLGIFGLVIGLATLAFVKLFSRAFLGRTRGVHELHAEPLSAFLVVPPLVGVVAILATGLYAFSIVGTLTSQSVATPRWLSSATLAPGASINVWLVFALLVGSALVTLMLRFIFARRLRMRTTGTWDCGAPLSPRMEQTATGFAASMRFFFRSVVLARKELLLTPVVATNPWIVSRSLSWSVASFWERALYQPLSRFVLRLSQVLRRLQSGVVQFYLLLMLIALLSVLIYAL